MDTQHALSRASAARRKPQNAVRAVMHRGPICPARGASSWRSGTRITTNRICVGAVGETDSNEEGADPPEMPVASVKEVLATGDRELLPQCLAPRTRPRDIVVPRGRAGTRQ